jgi:hypothetical protein
MSEEMPICRGVGPDFDLVKDPIAQRAARARETRSPATGWHKHTRDA